MDNQQELPRRPGRPPKATRMKEFPVHLYMPSQDALAKLKIAAESEGMSLSTWARIVLLREARRILGEE